MDQSAILSGLLQFQAEGRRLDNTVEASWTPACKVLIQDWHRRLTEFIRTNLPEHRERMPLKAFGMKGLFVAPWQKQADRENVAAMLALIQRLADELGTG